MCTAWTNSVASPDFLGEGILFEKVTEALKMCSRLTGHDVTDRLCIIACAQSVSNLLRRFKVLHHPRCVSDTDTFYVIIDVYPTTDHD